VDIINKFLLAPQGGAGFEFLIEKDFATAEAAAYESPDVGTSWTDLREGKMADLNRLMHARPDWRKEKKKFQEFITSIVGGSLA
jgi:hypothetical protein